MVSVLLCASVERVGVSRMRPPPARSPLPFKSALFVTLAVLFVEIENYSWFIKVLYLPVKGETGGFPINNVKLGTFCLTRQWPWLCLSSQDISCPFTKHHLELFWISGNPRFSWHGLTFIRSADLYMKVQKIFSVLGGLPEIGATSSADHYKKMLMHPYRSSFLNLSANRSRADRLEEICA